ncbi:hypothetical protein BD410DRAFT_715968 [Rickenella mellea]|uniref:Serine-threonine/tyrosine-protein kinase catalytic domain-containing protein n=1 Tax=Rickenella mellea TaxID=50990 RepID=A0A4Y7QGV1_9AGAM|nr:hypothetical protein BD410DRAFT_715968 [Rickenella mellea]
MCVFCQRILREARVWASTSHENVIPLLGYWTNFRSDNPFPALVSPWCNDSTLLDHVVKMEKKICVCNRLELVSDADFF